MIIIYGVLLVFGIVLGLFLLPIVISLIALPFVLLRDWRKPNH